MNKALLLIGFTILASACNRGPFTEMSDSTYVRTMVALRTLPVGSVDSASRARQRDSILKSFGVTQAQLESTAVRLSGDPVLAATIFRAIESGKVSPP